MLWQNLYQKQLHVNQYRQKQLEVIKIILRNFFPIIKQNSDEKISSFIL